MTTKPAFPALGAPMSPAWEHGSPRVEELALPKSVESGKLSLNKVGIGRMSVWRLANNHEQTQSCLQSAFIWRMSV
jgi:hypothetical protein